MIQLTMLDGEKKIFNPLNIRKIESGDGGGAMFLIGDNRYFVREPFDEIKRSVDNFLAPLVRPMTDKEIKAAETVTILKSEYEGLRMARSLK